MEELKPLVLITDDDGTFQALSRKVFEAVGYRVVVAGSGHDAIEMAKQERPDMILLDIEMPDISGIEVCNSIRQSPKGNDIPIVMLSGYKDNESIQRAFEVGATDYFIKPPNWIIINERIRYLLQASKAIRQLRSNEASLARAHAIAKQDVSQQKLAQMFEAGKSRLLQLLIEQAPISKIFQEIVSIIQKQLPQSAAAVSVVRGGSIDVVVGHDAAVSFLAYRKRTAHGVFGDKGSPSDKLTLSAAPGFLFEDFNTHTVVPFCYGTGKLIGTLDVFTKNKGENLTFLDQLGGLAAVVVEHYHLTNQLIQQALQDPLTGLLNRTALEELVEAAIARAETDKSRCAFLLFDLDKFKNINDTLGHQAGDTLLKTVAARLKSIIRNTDYLGRIGGDEFLLVLTELKSTESIARTAQRMLDAISEPYHLDVRLIHIDISIGISIFPDDGENFAILQKNADVAMYSAKNKGGGRFCFYKAGMSSMAIAKMDMESRIHGALEKDEFLLHYQPKYNMRTREIVGLEALLRWYQPEQGFVAPSDFIPIAEQSNLIVKIGDMVLEKTCRQIAVWREKFSLKWPVAVNVSAIQLRTTVFAEKVRELQRKFRIPLTLLEIEITETSILKYQEEVAQNFSLFKEMGLKTTIDDFGTGYCSITYLRSIPLDCLKIDRSFVDELNASSSTHEKSLQLIRGIIGLSANMGIEVVAEGVENNEQCRHLLESGCEIGQGFLFSKPLPPEEIEKLIVSHQAFRTEVVS